MKIENKWKQMGELEDDVLSSLLQPGQVRKLHSSNPLRKIRNSLVFSMIWAVLIAALYIYILFLFPQWPVILCIGVVLLFTLWAGYSAFKQYSGIQTYVAEQSLLSEMEKHYAGINNWMKAQMKIAIFVYPVAATGGFMIGGIMGSGKSIAFFLSKPFVIIALIVVIAVLVPCCIWLAKWLFKKSYGKHLATLKKNIDELKNG